MLAKDRHDLVREIDRVGEGEVRLEKEDGQEAHAGGGNVRKA
jgi:hypothetical protein